MSKKKRPAFAVKTRPAHRSPTLHINEAVRLHREGDLATAETLYQSILKQDPEHFEALQLLGVLKIRQGLHAEALGYLDRALCIRDDVPVVYNNRGIALHHGKRHDEALASYAEALKRKPDYAESWYNQGIVLQETGQLLAALNSYDRALALRPEYHEAHGNKGNTLKSLHRLDEALACYRACLALKPDYSTALYNLSEALAELGRFDDAVEQFYAALRITPHPQHYSNYLFMLACYGERQSPEAMRKVAEGWETLALTDAEQHTAHERCFNPPPRSGRPLKLGILSAELGQHAVAYFLGSWLPHLDSQRVTLYLYPTRPRQEAQAEAFKSLTPHGYPVDTLDDATAAERIRADGIDILLDVSGHTEHNRLGILAHRAAPVQCHYIGFFASTGLREIDYFLADGVLIPPELDTQFTETVWRLPRPWLAYRPLENAPEPGWQAPDDGTVCLGSFNNLVKVREDCLDLWARVLRALPEAWLLLKDGKATDAATQQRIRDGLTRRGVDVRKIAFAARTADWQAHMALYDQVDIALDTIPLNSGTTAFDALWMGVPLITLAGNTMAGRMGAAIVSGIGHPEWVADEEADYVAKVIALARDLPLRQRLRISQRERMRHSPLCDGVGLARTLETAFAAMFDRRFPPESAPAIDSEPEDTALEQALHLHRQGQLAEAEARYRAILDRNPEHFDALQLLGALAAQQGQWSVALGYLDRALLIRQDQAETHYNRGIVLQNLEQPEAAIDSYRQTLALDDGHLNARNNLGLMLQSLERLDEARQAYEQVLELQPDFAEVHCNLGNVFKDMQQLPEALRCYEQAIRLKPDYALAYYNKGNLLSELQQPQEALGCYAQAIRLKPDYAVAYFNQGNTLKNLGDCGAALSSYDQALQFKPDYAEAHYNSGNVLRELHRFGDGLAHYQQALTVRSDFADVYVNRSNTYKDLGYLVEAETGYRQALSLSPGNPHYHSNLLFLLGYCPERQTPAAYLKEARCWETMVLTDIQRRAAHEFGFKQVSRSQRPLRIGILSAELGRHAVAYFLVPWLSKRDRNRISLFLYPTRQCTDEYAASFEAMADAWCPVDELEDEAAVQRIRADQIDILIETSGHTAGNRLGIIARRAAPIQCHYIGYFASTGLSTMDYLLADDVLIPPALETQFTETIWRLPRSWLAYQPLEQAPEPGWLPAEDGRICLGSFNNLVKVREDCLRLWAGVLKALPEAWLLLKDGRATDPASQRRIREALQALGVDEQRVVFAGRMKDWAEHMRLYDQVDIALDTLPMNSGTTAFDALWMGVPLITLAGSTLAGRMGAAIVTGLGHPEWVAADEADYVTKVVALARDVDTRKRLRHTQREQMRNSPLCDGEGLARSLEAAFEAMFDRRWSAAHTT